MEIINTIHVKNLKIVESQPNTLNFVDIDTKKDKLWTIGARYRKMLLIISINYTKATFITCNQLNDAKTNIIYDGEYQTLSTVNLDEITNRTLIKSSFN